MVTQEVRNIGLLGPIPWDPVWVDAQLHERTFN